MSHTSPAGNAREIRISADSHMVETSQVQDHLPRAFRGRVQRFRSPARASDPSQRLEDMAVDGVSAEVLYPQTPSNQAYWSRGPESEAYVRAYNDWMVEFCSEAPERFWGQAVIPLWDMDFAVPELQRCAKAGLKGATTWLTPPEEQPFASEHYERFWAAAQDLAMPVSMHINAAFGADLEARRPGSVEDLQHNTYGRKAAAMKALTDIIFSGVLQRHPGLKVVTGEAQVGWIPYWIQECDRSVHRSAENGEYVLPLLPSEYFERQIYATFVDDTLGGYTLPRWGVDNFMWSNDYPHGQGIWPGSTEVIERTLGHLRGEDREKVLCRNVAGLYHMPVPAPIETSAMRPDFGEWSHKLQRHVERALPVVAQRQAADQPPMAVTP